MMPRKGQWRPFAPGYFVTVTYRVLATRVLLIRTIYGYDHFKKGGDRENKIEKMSSVIKCGFFSFPAENVGKFKTWFLEEIIAHTYVKMTKLAGDRVWRIEVGKIKNTSTAIVVFEHVAKAIIPSCAFPVGIIRRTEETDDYFAVETYDKSFQLFEFMDMVNLQHKIQNEGNTRLFEQRRCCETPLRRPKPPTVPELDFSRKNRRKNRRAENFEAGNGLACDICNCECDSPLKIDNAMVCLLCKNMRI